MPTAATASPRPIDRPGPTWRVSSPITAMTAIDATVAGSSAAPASSGEKPRTSCRYCEKKNRSPVSAKTDSEFATTAPAKAGMRKSCRSISGVARMRWRRTNHHPAPMPTSAATGTVQSAPCPTRCFTA